MKDFITSKGRAHILMREGSKASGIYNLHRQLRQKTRLQPLQSQLATSGKWFVVENFHCQFSLLNGRVFLLQMRCCWCICLMKPNIHIDLSWLLRREWVSAFGMAFIYVKAMSLCLPQYTVWIYTDLPHVGYATSLLENVHNQTHAAAVIVIRKTNYSSRTVNLHYFVWKLYTVSCGNCQAPYINFSFILS